MAEDKALSPPSPSGIKKSSSTRSHVSVYTTGVHPLGSLKVHEPKETSPLVSSGPIGDSEREDSPPPPLDPPAYTGTSRQTPSLGIKEESKLLTGKLNQTRTSRSRNSVTHSRGGGDVVLILGLPEVFSVGYDAVSFTAKHFGGVKDISRGPHFFWVSHPSGGSARSGFWVVSSGVDQVHVMQWDTFNETLLESAQAEALIQAENIDSFHDKLVPFQDPTAGRQGDGGGELSIPTSAKNQRIWEQLTGSISPKVLDRITGQSGSNWQVNTTDHVQGTVLMAAEIELENAITNPLLQTRELHFIFTQHSKTYSADSIGADRTLAAMDATQYIVSSIESPDNDCSEEDIVGELQFAYIVGMHLGNDACIQQWWHIFMKLILKAYLLPLRRPVLAANLFRTVASQITHSSDWLDGSILDYGNANSHDMRLALIIYKRRLAELLGGINNDATPDQLAVDTAFAKVEAVVAALGWDISGDYLRKGKVVMEDGEEVELEMDDLQEEDSRGEWAPEVVELDEHGRQRDILSWSD